MSSVRRFTIYPRRKYSEASAQGRSCPYPEKGSVFYHLAECGKRPRFGSPPVRYHGRRVKVPWIRERPGTGDHHKVTTKNSLIVRGGHCGQTSVLLTRAASQVHAAVSKPGGLHPGQNLLFLGLWWQLRMERSTRAAAHFCRFFAGEPKWPQRYEIPRRRQKKMYCSAHLSWVLIWISSLCASGCLFASWDIRTDRLGLDRPYTGICDIYIYIYIYERSHNVDNTFTSDVVCLFFSAWIFAVYWTTKLLPSFWASVVYSCPMAGRVGSRAQGGGLDP